MFNTDLSPNEYDPRVRFNEFNNMTVISLEDLDPSQTVGDDHASPQDDEDNTIWDNDDNYGSDNVIEEEDHLPSIDDLPTDMSEEEGDEELDEIGDNEDFYEDLYEEDPDED